MNTKKILMDALAIAMIATASSAGAQSSQTYHPNTPVGPVTHTTTTYNNGSGTTTTHSVTPGNNSSVTPYLGATINDPHPTNQAATTTVTTGVSIPF